MSSILPAVELAYGAPGVKSIVALLATRWRAALAWVAVAQEKPIETAKKQVAVEFKAKNYSTLIIF